MKKPESHHIDKRAGQLVTLFADRCGHLDAIRTVPLAEALGVSKQFLELGRTFGWGPAYERVPNPGSPPVIIYRPKKILSWLRDRARAAGR